MSNMAYELKLAREAGKDDYARFLANAIIWNLYLIG